MQEPFHKRIFSLEARILNLEKMLAVTIKGQSQTFPPILQTLRRGEAGLTDPHRPKGAFIALGPTGVGKTETIKVVDNTLFRNPKSLVRLDMSAYKRVSDIEQFVGSATRKGDLQVQMDEAGEEGRILQLDEIEKAHPAIFDLLLQILDEGWLRLHNGDSLNFRNWYIWATSNIGAELSTKGRNPSPSLMAQALTQALRDTIRPEIVERFSNILIYQRLTERVQAQIAEHLLNHEIERLNSTIGSTFKVAELQQLVNFMLRQGYTEAYGARRMKRTIQEHTQLAAYRALLQNTTEGYYHLENRRLQIQKELSRNGGERSPSALTRAEANQTT